MNGKMSKRSPKDTMFAILFPMVQPWPRYGIRWDTFSCDMNTNYYKFIFVFINVLSILNICNKFDTFLYPMNWFIIFFPPSKSEVKVMFSILTTHTIKVT